MKKYVKFAALVLALAMAFSLAGCTKADSENTIVMATSADYAPYEFHIMKDGVDTIVGFDVSLAQKIAEDMGKELVIKDVAFEVMMAELEKGTADMVLAAIEENEERLAVSDFSDSYYTDLPAMVLVRAADVDKYTSKDSFSGKVVGAQVATTKEELVKTEFTGAELLSLSAVPDLINNLLFEKCDAVCLDGAVAMGYAESNPDVKVAPVELGEALPYGVAVQKGDPKGLLKSINDTIAKAIESGDMEKWMEEANTQSADALE